MERGQESLEHTMYGLIAWRCLKGPSEPEVVFVTLCSITKFKYGPNRRNGGLFEDAIGVPHDVKYM